MLMDRDTLQLLEGFAHELRTPLSAIAGHSSLLSLGAHGPLTEAQAHALNRIEANKQQMIALIGHLLTYAEAASGALTHSVEECALRPIIAQQVANLEEAARERDVQIHWSDADGLSDANDGPAKRSFADVALVSERTTHEVLAILLQDALAHSEPSSVLQVRLHHTKEWLRVVMESRGPATAEHSADLLFVPYARDTDGRPLSLPGSALALPRARALARSMGAEVRAHFADSHRIVQFEVGRTANLRALAG